jgi:very-short-patch-repair endonuclease
MPHHPVRPIIRERAKVMRSEMTNAEAKLWHELRAGRLMGLKFRRQVPIADYIVDFACPEHKLIVEVDGFTHGNEVSELSDAKRTSDLERLGWRVLRFQNEHVYSHINDTCEHILSVTNQLARPQALA